MDAMDDDDVWTILVIRGRCGGTSLETAFLATLLEYPEARGKIELAIQERLNLTEPVRFAEKIEWQFHSAACLVKPRACNEEELAEHHYKLLERGILSFNVGDEYGPGMIDHHGLQFEGTEATIVAVDLLRTESHDFLDALPWLRDVYLRVSMNDGTAARLSRGEGNIRSLMSGLICLRPRDDQFFLEVLLNAFLGSFEKAKEGVRDEKSLSVKSAIEGLEKRSPEAATRLKEVWQQAQEAADRDWEMACSDVDKAIELGKTANVFHPTLSLKLNRELKIIHVRSNALKAAAATRRKGYRFDVCLVTRPNGDQSTQIFSADIIEREKLSRDAGRKPRPADKWRIDLGEVARELRSLEGRFSNRRPESGDWTMVGYVYDKAGQAIPWYLADFRTMLANRTLGSPNVPVTCIREDKIFKALVENLPKCDLLRLGEDDEWRPYGHTPSNVPKKFQRHRRKGKGGRQNGNNPRPQGPAHDGLTHNMDLTTYKR